MTLVPSHQGSRCAADRDRGAAYLSVLIAGAGMFGIFLFVTYYLQVSLGYSPIRTGLSFLPMIGMLVLAAQLSTNLLLPRFGNHGLWAALMVLNAARGVTLALRYPALEARASLPAPG